MRVSRIVSSQHMYKDHTFKIKLHVIRACACMVYTLIDKRIVA